MKETEEKNNKYGEALDLIESGNYEKAYNILKDLGEYKDAKSLLADFYYVPVKATYNQNDFFEHRPSEPMVYEFVYNENNLLTQVIYDDSPLMSITYREDSNIIQKISNGNGDNESYATYTYDDKGNIIQKSSVESNGAKTFTEYMYDANGKLIKEIYTHFYGVQDVTDFTYDDKGNILTKVYTAYDGESKITNYTYNTNGKIIKIESDDFGNLKGVIEYTYDNNGNLNKEIFTASEKFQVAVEYTYDKKGRVTRKSQVVTRIYDNSNSTIDYTYDTNGNVVLQTLTTDIRLQRSCEIEYKLVYLKYEIPQEIQTYLNKWIDCFNDQIPR